MLKVKCSAQRWLRNIALHTCMAWRNVGVALLSFETFRSARNAWFILQPLRSVTQSQAGTSRALSSPAGIPSRGVSISRCQFQKNAAEISYTWKKQTKKTTTVVSLFTSVSSSNLLSVPPSVTFRVTLLTRHAWNLKSQFDIVQRNCAVSHYLVTNDIMMPFGKVVFECGHRTWTMIPTTVDRHCFLFWVRGFSLFCSLNFIYDAHNKCFEL